MSLLQNQPLYQRSALARHNKIVRLKWFENNFYCLFLDPRIWSRRVLLRSVAFQDLCDPEAALLYLLSGLQYIGNSYVQVFQHPYQDFYTRSFPVGYLLSRLCLDVRLCCSASKPSSSAKVLTPAPGSRSGHSSAKAHPWHRVQPFHLATVASARLVWYQYQNMQLSSL